MSGILALLDPYRAIRSKFARKRRRADDPAAAARGDQAIPARMLHRHEAIVAESEREQTDLERLSLARNRLSLRRKRESVVLE